jgi:hypothetical protein
MATSLNSEHQEAEAQLNALLVDIGACKTSIAGLNAKLDSTMSTLYTTAGGIGGTTIANIAGTNFASLWNVPTLTATAGT